MRVAYDVLEMPLYSVYPALQIESVLYLVALVWVVDRSLNVVLNVIVGDGLVENVVAKF